MRNLSMALLREQSVENQESGAEGDPDVCGVENRECADSDVIRHESVRESIENVCQRAPEDEPEGDAGFPVFRTEGNGGDRDECAEDQDSLEHRGECDTEGDVRIVDEA